MKNDFEVLPFQTSHLSIGSNADVFSLGSDDMNALVTDMTFKVPLFDGLNEEGSTTETEENRPKVPFYCFSSMS